MLALKSILTVHQLNLTGPIRGVLAPFLPSRQDNTISRERKKTKEGSRMEESVY